MLFGLVSQPVEDDVRFSRNVSEQSVSHNTQGLEPKNNAADQLATDILGDGFLHASGPARIWYATIIGG